MENILYPSLHLILSEYELIDCQYGGRCYNTSSKHNQTHRHPPFCPHNGYCRQMSNDHLLTYRHVPLCKYALQCHKKEIPDHARLYRHCNRNCSNGRFCVKFHDTIHTESLSHSFLTPCPLTPYNCSQHDELIRNFPHVSNDILLHCYQYAHVCYWGRQCPFSNEEHIQTSIHVARNFCSHGVLCDNLLNENHLNSYSHIGLLDIRQSCSNGNICSLQQNLQHITLYRHEDRYHFNVALYFGFDQDTNYIQNQNDMLRAVEEYIVKKEQQRLVISDDIINFIRVIQPIHRCKKDIFESILCQGHLMSSYYMGLLIEAKEAADRVWTQIQTHIRRDNSEALEQTVYRFVLTLIENELKIIEKQSTEHCDHIIFDSIQFCENQLASSLLNREQIDFIRQLSVKLAKESLHLYNHRPGIQHEADKNFGTDNHVFSILGPNLGHRYGDIIILFKRDLMQHPAANLAIQAATTFGKSERAYKWRPWLTDPGDIELRAKHFHSNLLHCSAQSYENAAAAELIAITAQELNMNFNEVSLEQVIERWLITDPHRRFEAHLPALIPLDYIEQIYMPNSVFQSLSLSAQKSTNEIFGSRLTITNHEVSPDDSIDIKIDSKRKTYQHFVLQEIIERYKHVARNGHDLEMKERQRGFVITLSASKLETLVRIPIRISQSRMQFFQSSSQISFQPSIFIYWQALGGDMMIVLSNESIHIDEKQSKLCTLMCYIAAPPSKNRQEEYSYMSSAPFYSHYITQNPQDVYEVSSKTFHRGCNSQSYLTYCLQIESNTGQVTLSHAGPDTIYNHEKLSYQFRKNHLDLSILDYVQLSAGKKAVPVRNFVIVHERIPQLHPSFDKNVR